ncbi:Uncharacterised protein [uncultured archaeon]|nr:Uncharacterised protein [uncultured archaeon]
MFVWLFVVKKFGIRFVLLSLRSMLKMDAFEDIVAMPGLVVAFDIIVMLPFRFSSSSIQLIDMEPISSVFAKNLDQYGDV